jgi:hypothetical protein
MTPLHDLLETSVESGRVPGAAALVARGEDVEVAGTGEVEFLDSGLQVDVKTQCPFSSWAWLCSTFDPVPSKVDAHLLCRLIRQHRREGCREPKGRHRAKVATH